MKSLDTEFRAARCGQLTVLGLERLVSERFELGTINGALEELDEGLPVASAILSQCYGKLLFEVERVGADGSMRWGIGAGSRAELSGDVDHDGRACVGVRRSTRSWWLETSGLALTVLVGSRMLFQCGYRRGEGGCGEGSVTTVPDADGKFAGNAVEAAVMGKMRIAGRR